MSEPRLSPVPIRIQRQRTKGWRMPPGAIYVGRPTRWSNPFAFDTHWIAWAAVSRGFRGDRAGRTAASVAFFREWLTGTPARGPQAESKAGDEISYEDGTVLDTATAARSVAAAIADRRLPAAFASIPLPTPAEIRAKLRGHDLVCWCPLGQACHADVLLEIANAPLRCEAT